MLNDGLAAAVAAVPAGWSGRYFDAIGSTQDEARAAALQGAPSRSIFVANYQQAGRGRRGRLWQAAPGVALTLSVLLRDTAATPVPWRWTSLASVALVDAIRALAPELQPAIKWPNDVVLDGRKLAGILAENSWDGVQLLAIVGIGVNVRTEAAELRSLGRNATSLRAATGRDIDRGDLLIALMRRMEYWLEQPPSMLHAVWEAGLWGRDQRLRLVDLDCEAEVIVLGAEPDGALRVRMADGSERRTTTGELII